MQKQPFWKTILEWGLPALLAAAGAFAIVAWIGTDPTASFELRVPGLEGKPLIVLDEGPGEIKPGKPVTGEGKPSAISGSWPCFRGPNRDGISPDPTPLTRSLPQNGPPLLWQIELGPGHAGAAIADGRVFVLDYDPLAQADTIRCLSLDDGREIWRNSYPVVIPENHGMSRTVPAVAEGHVVTLGPKCHLACWDEQSGECLWFVDLVQRYKTKVPPWYTGQCPLIDNGRVIVAPAGTAFMVALDLHTGDVIWESPPIPNWDMTHVSVVPVEIAGRKIYVYCGTGGVAGVDAETGQLVWRSDQWVGKMATCPSPVPVGDGRIFFCGGYGAGSVMLELHASDGNITSDVVFRLLPRQFGSEHHTPIFYKGYLYGVRTKAGGEQLVCLNLEGKEQWNSGREKFGRGPYIVADGLLILLGDNGQLWLVEATPERYRPLAHWQVWPDAQDPWGPLAIAHGRLVLRDLTRMACVDLSAPPASTSETSQ